MAEGEGLPPLKKVKFSDDVDVTDDIFITFHRKYLDTLKDAYDLISFKQSGYAFGIAKIKFCDAQCSTIFSEARCNCDIYARNSTSMPRGFGLKGIFQYGFDVVESYLECPYLLPERKGAILALEKLLSFLSDTESAQKALASKDVSDTEWTKRIVHHLLSKLAVGSNYMLDDQSRGKSKDLKCNCGCGQKLFGSYGDTSIGVPSYWHGRIDILMDVAVKVVSEDLDPPGGGNDSFTESNCSSERMAASRQQIRAETIVFSFLQKKNHPDLENFLIPTVAISKTQVAICLYDSQNDIFLESPLLDLFHESLEGRCFKFATVLTLWAALNFKYCCSGVPEEIIDLDYKADFYKYVGPILEKYSLDVKSPCDYQSTIGWFSIPIHEDVKEKKSDINKIRMVTKK